MKTYNVTITSQQKGKSVNTFDNQTESQVNSIIEKYWDNDYERPLMNGESFELNNDQYIKIEEIF